MPDLTTGTLTRVGDLLYFTRQTDEGLEVWKSDGTSSGTTAVVTGLSHRGAPSYEGTANGLFFFTFQVGDGNDLRLWRSDGTAEGTFPVTEEVDGNGAAGGTFALTQYIEFNNELYVVVRSSSIFSHPRSVGIIKTDGTVENTVPVKAVHEGNQRLLKYADVIEINDKLYFSFFEGEAHRLFIWESDGTEAGTQLIYDVSGPTY